MSNYKQVTIHTGDRAKQEELIAILSDEGFEGFEETESALNAFITESNYDAQQLSELATQHSFGFDIHDIEERNWNEVWESNFEPVLVENFVSIRAEFHPPAASVEWELVITPKMSFGTGHHATTWMMIKQMKSVDFKNKSVLDFGTGTGVLAILAEKLGATEVFAIDHDEWSITNSRENIARNECTHVELILADDARTNKQFDIILANINRNVILDNLEALKAGIRMGGTILFSGLLISDKDDMIKATAEAGFILRESIERDNWLCLNCVRG